MTNSAMIIDSYHDPELYKLVDKQFKKEGQQQWADAYEIRLDNKSTLSATQLFYNGHPDLTPGETKQINTADLKPERIHATMEYTTDLKTLEQKTVYHLSLDEKFSEWRHVAEQVPFNTTKHGVAIHGELDQHLSNQLNISQNDLTVLALASTIASNPYFKADTTTPAVIKDAVTQESKIAEKLFDNVSLTNEFATNMLSVGTTQDLNKYYLHTQSDLFHIDAYSVTSHKEVIAAQQEALTQKNDQYQYVGLIHYQDNSGTSIAYTNANEYLHAIEEGLKTRPQSLGYETISQDPQLHKQVDDLVYKFYGLSNPNPIESYTEQGRPVISLNEANNHQISIMDLAKEMGFTYRNTNQEGDTIMQKIIQPNENTQQVTQIDLIIKNADNPLTNIVTVEYARFNDSKSMTQDANFNPVAQDADYHLPFKDFVALTKPLNSEEIVKNMENRQNEIVGTLFYKDTKETISYTDPEKYLRALSDALDTQPNNIKYETLTNNPDTRQKVDDLVFGLYGMENPHPREYYTQQQQQYTTETQPKNDFNYETSSIRPQQHLIEDLQQKFKLDPETIAKFAPFMEAAHPMEKNATDKSADIVVFPYVKMDDQYNLKGHSQSTMSGEALGEKTTNSTNLPIAYEHYTQGQTIPYTQSIQEATQNGGVWMATTATNPQSVKDVFMFNSAIDAMSFYETHKNAIDLNNTALISVGSLARESQILGVAERFPDAHIHTAFNNTLLGKLSDITVIAAASIGEVRFEATDKQSINFTTYTDKFTLPIKEINLLSFKKHAHIKDHGINYDLSDIKIHHPQNQSYNADLIQHKQEERQERNHSMKL